MIRRECKEIGNITQCQIPYNEQWLSGIIDLVALVAILWFIVHMVIRFLGRIVK